MSINIGLIGYGYWGKILAKYLDESPTFNLKHIFGRSLTKAGRQTNELSEILCDPDVKAVVVVTPIGTHYEIVKQALESGKHVFCEKPLCISSADAEQLWAMAKERELSLFVDFVYTFSPGLEIASLYFKNGKIGKLWRVKIESKKLGKFTQYGNVYWTLGTHALSILDIFCPLTNFLFKTEREIMPGGQVESASISFRTDTDPMDHVTGRIDLTMNYPSKQTEVILYGSEGTIIYNLPYGGWTVQICRYDRLPNIPTASLVKNAISISTDESNNLRHSVARFADIILKGYPSNVDTAVKITKIIEGML